jgi:flagellin
MSLRINYNDAAANAHRNLQSTSNSMSKSIERLSSGFRINRASDDPAGLAISENLRAQVSGLGQAVSNSSDAVNLIKTAEGALAEVHTQLRTMRNLALHASNTGTNDDTALDANQAQITSSLAAL